MGIMVTKDNDDTELSKRINADLRTSAVATSDSYETDLVESSEYLKETAKTGRFAWIWMILGILALISLVFIILL